MRLLKTMSHKVQITYSLKTRNIKCTHRTATLKMRSCILMDFSSSSFSFHSVFEILTHCSFELPIKKYCRRTIAIITLKLRGIRKKKIHKKCFRTFFFFYYHSIQNERKKYQSRLANMHRNSYSQFQKDNQFQPKLITVKFSIRKINRFHCFDFPLLSKSMLRDFTFIFVAKVSKCIFFFFFFIDFSVFHCVCLGA